MSERFDIVIVGAGPGGIGAGAHAARRDLKHVVLDSARIANTIYRYQKGKLVMAEPSQIPLHPELQLDFREGSREDVLAAWNEGTEAAGTNLRAGPEYEVQGIDGECGSFELRLAGAPAIQADRVVLAIGLQGNPRRFGVPGDDLPHVTYQLDDPAEYEDERIVVVGAGDAAIENALGLVSTGNHVVVVNRREEFPRAKDANRKLIERAIQRDDVEFFPNSQVLRFEERATVLTTRDGEARVETDRVIGRLGGMPPRRFLEGMGIEFSSDDPAAIPSLSETLETNVAGIHLIGALAGYPLIKHCMNQGVEVVDRILGNPFVPADQHLLEELFAGMSGSVEEILERIRQTVPLFHPLTSVQMREFVVYSKMRRLQRGDMVTKHGDVTDDFYSILDGSVEIEIETPGGTPSGKVTLGGGEFFGEMSLISGRGRNATVVAAEESTLIETPRLAMTRLVLSSADVKRELDHTFLRRSLINMIPELALEKVEELVAAAQSREFKQGEYLFREGDPFDGLYLIRRGSVTISRLTAGVEAIVNYVQAGSHRSLIGEGGLGEQTRSASVRAAIETEVIWLPGDVVERVLADSEEVRDRFHAQSLEYIGIDVDRSSFRHGSDIANFLMLDPATGGSEATDLLLIDESLCVHCDNCEKACAETHGGVTRLDRQAGPVFAGIKVPTTCRHCDNPKCMTDCPPDAVRRDPNGEVYILDTCIGCGNCVSNCPYDVIQMKELEPAKHGPLWDLFFGKGEEASPQKQAVKCDLCVGRPVRERGGTACTQACPTGALIRVNPKDYISEQSGGR